MCSAAGASRGAPSAAVSASVRIARCCSRLLIDAPAAPAGVLESYERADRMPVESHQNSLSVQHFTTRRAVRDDPPPAGSNGGPGELSTDEEPSPVVSVCFVATHEFVRTKFHAVAPD